MILLDTHVWVWWVLGNPRLSAEKLRLLEEAEDEGLGVSIMSCWEVAKLVELGRLDLPVSLEEWLAQALRYPGVQLLDLTIEIVIEATRLPGEFHRDPCRSALGSYRPSSRYAPGERGSEDLGLRASPDIELQIEPDHMPPAPRVFISYSHDSDAHKARVLALANRLRHDGVDVRLDQYEPSPKEGWPRWTRRGALLPGRPRDGAIARSGLRRRDRGSV